MRDRIEEALRKVLAPTAIEVRDVSAAHAGHAGAPAGGESHFEVSMTAPAFAGQGRLARHRAVHAALGERIVNAIHALQLDLRAPEEREGG
ncbi:BolA family protein [Hasllibacter halocynthiae]|nr:BolA family protein [Hasllibacter halocynthiae]